MSTQPFISIIIPTYEEADYLCHTIDRIREAGSLPAEIIVVDASKDNQTRKQAQTYSDSVVLLHSPIKQRAHQLNIGAERAQADILLFLHADCLLPQSFDKLISDRMDDGLAFGQFALRFDGGPAVLKFHEKGSRKQSAFSGGGDQSLWIKRSLFDALGGYDDSFDCMEDYDLYDRARKKAKGTIITKAIVTSARKYQKYSYVRVQLYNLLMMAVYKCTRSARIVNHFA